METIDILRKNGFSRNPNGVTVVFEGCDNLPIGTTWSGKYQADVIPTNYGFKIFQQHGYLCPPTEIQFPKHATEDNFEGAYKRLIDFASKNYEVSVGLPPYLWGD